MTAGSCVITNDAHTSITAGTSGNDASLGALSMSSSTLGFD